MTAPRTLPGHLAHPFSPRGRLDPYPAYRWLRENDPVHFDVTSRMWLLTAHADCALALRDPRFSAALGQRERVRDDELPPSMLTTDPPEHQRLRSPGALLMGPAAIRGIAAGIEAEIDAVLDGLATRAANGPAGDAANASGSAGGGMIEATADLGEPLATGVLARLFGLPPADVPAFAALADRVSVNLDPLAGAQAAAAGRAAMGELTRFLGERADAAAATANEPGGSPFGRLAADDRLTRAETLGIAALTVVGGWKPLAEMVGNALHWLLPRKEAADLIRHGGQEVAVSAVDELLRLESPIPFTARVTTEAVTLDGGVIPAGARVLALVGAANRDPAVFDGPDELLVTRSPNPHLAFGAGTHLCLGAPLVRQAGGLLLSGLLGRYPGLRPAGEPPTWAPGLVPRRLTGFTLAI
ncbi:cytochrome P450 [Nonomuraea spiralis]|uniref:Cytochrome P450 n=1 Tax=Nonomuraea spiralis TaxID=46182 RepID=A0ABV5IFR3_9ACTN|nr:cytochrome P450 [Nonomuraea spiralis]GGS71884.1 cytochrome P450 [Nonomuraea spiralis]